MKVFMLLQNSYHEASQWWCDLKLFFISVLSLGFFRFRVVLLFYSIADIDIYNLKYWTMHKISEKKFTQQFCCKGTSNSPAQGNLVLSYICLKKLELTFLTLKASSWWTICEGFCGGRKGTFLFPSISSYFFLNEINEQRRPIWIQHIYAILPSWVQR